MILLLGQTRVFFAMSRDGLLPRFFSPSTRVQTPHRPTILLGVIIAILAGSPPHELAELVNIGTLFAFVVVAIGVIVLRRTRPDLPRAFRTPWVPLMPILSVLASLWLMLNLPAETWLRFGDLDGARVRSCTSCTAAPTAASAATRRRGVRAAEPPGPSTAATDPSATGASLRTDALQPSVRGPLTSAPSSVTLAAVPGPP